MISTFIHSANSNGKAEIVQNYNMNIGVGVDVMHTFIMIIENLQKSRKKLPLISSFDCAVTDERSYESWVLDLDSNIAKTALKSI